MAQGRPLSPYERKRHSIKEVQSLWAGLLIAGTIIMTLYGILRVFI